MGQGNLDQPIISAEAGRSGTRGRIWGLDPLKALFSSWLVFYLLTHGVSLPSDGRIELGELAVSLYYGSLSWLRIPAAWVSTVVEFLGRICSTTRWS